MKLIETSSTRKMQNMIWNWLKTPKYEKDMKHKQNLSKLQRIRKNVKYKQKPAVLNMEQMFSLLQCVMNIGHNFFNILGHIPQTFEKQTGKQIAPVTQH